MGIVNNGGALGSTALRKVRERTALDRSDDHPFLRSPSAPAQRAVFAAPQLSEDDIPAGLLHHFQQAQTRLGRFRLNAYLLSLQLRRAVETRVPALLKRSIDVVGSLVLLLLLSPVFAVVALLVKLEDGGPVFFAQRRVGLRGREFMMYKIRSMCTNAEARLSTLLQENEHREGVTFKLKDDPRITRVGKWLRKLSVDELPQLYNVLIGNMSLVGPRPPVPREVAMYSLSDRRRLSIKPGITCIWQISGRAEIDFSGQVNLDVQYIENRSLGKDVSILLRTLPAVISGRGAC